MEIIRSVEGLGFKVVGKRCDSCKRDWRSYRSVDEELEMFEFTRIEVHAGYMAVRFVDGDRLVADLCQHCTYARLGKILRHLGNEFEVPPPRNKWRRLKNSGSRPSTGAIALRPCISVGHQVDADL